MPGSLIQVAVAAHKPYEMPGDPAYLPMHVGRALHPQLVEAMGPSFVGDDTGDNISKLNPTFCELTALYWLWRNSDADVKGLVHYRRHFASASRSPVPGEPLTGVATGEELLAALASADVVLPRRRMYWIETIRSHYAHTLPIEPLDAMRDLLADEEPARIPAFDAVMRARGAHMFNMCAMRRDGFDAYCAWLFPLLFELVRRVDPARYSAFDARFPGRVSELLMDVWVRSEGLKVSELPTLSPETVDWRRKGTAFLAAKFLGKKYKNSF